MKTKIIPILALLAFAACKPTNEQVVLQYPNGDPELVYIVSGKNYDEQTVIGEKWYYENKQLRAEKYYDKKMGMGSPDGEWKYYYSDGTLFAKGSFDAAHPLGSNWTFNRPDKTPYYKGAIDSTVVLELSAKQMPATVAYYHADSMMVFKFFDDYSLQSEGLLINNQREGRWNYYYPDGTPQVEATFTDGKENGAYKCYRENGVPIYIGYYINGKRANIWEFYDMDGNLSGTKNFDE